jgi:hypothetical protein
MRLKVFPKIIISLLFLLPVVMPVFAASDSENSYIIAKKDTSKKYKRSYSYPTSTPSPANRTLYITTDGIGETNLRVTKNSKITWVNQVQVPYTLDITPPNSLIGWAFGKKPKTETAQIPVGGTFSKKLYNTGKYIFKLSGKTVIDGTIVVK